MEAEHRSFTAKKQQQVHFKKHNFACSGMLLVD